jgi:chemotaxis protein methyltransferase CheR
LEPTKRYLVESRLTPLARKHGCEGLQDLVAVLRRTPFGSLHDQVVDAMTTNETSFFRDVHPFETLRTDIVPELIQRRADRQSLNIWSAACSSGQEPYTIGLIMREHFPQLARWNVKIYGTDISREMLARATKGCYSQAEVNRGLPATYLVKHFQREGLHWVIKPEIRALVAFLRLNLTENWAALPTMDVIFMRNVLIYFAPATKRLILDKVYRQLAPDGTLFLGGAETTLGLNDQFKRVNLGKTILYRRSD